MPGTTHNMLETMSGQAVPADCGENAAPQCNVLANEKQPFISLGCAAGIRMKANPECFVILLSSNPISISGHSINRIRVRLKVITGPAEAATSPQPGPAASTEVWGGQSCTQGSPCSAPPQRFGLCLQPPPAPPEPLCC